MGLLNFFRRFLSSSPPYPGISFTVPARAAFLSAQRVAEGWGHEYLGTEHLLAALARNPDCRAAAILRNLGMPREKLDALLAQMIQRGPEKMVVFGRLPHTPRLRKAVNRAHEGLRGRVVVGTADLLLGLLQTEDSVTSVLLESHRITAAVVQVALADPALPSERADADERHP